MIKAKLYHKKEINDELPMPKQPSANVFVDLPLPEPSSKKVLQSQNDEDPLDLQVDYTE